MPGVPAITVILCTRGRPKGTVQAIQSILAGSWSDFDLLVVDQSAGPETREAVAAIAAADDRVQYQHAPPCGKTTALNIGLTRAHSALIAFTDDDCEASPGWLSDIVWAFGADARLTLLVGAVVAGPHDASRGFVPTFEPVRRLCGLKVLTSGDNPMGANMAMRATLPRAIGGFDPVLGAGAPLRSSYDLAYCYRTYRLGRRLCADPSIVVVHHGFRTWAEGKRLVEGYAIGTAAAYTKFVRLGDPLALIMLLRDLGDFVMRAFYQTLVLRRPQHLTALLYRLIGIAKSYRYAVDRTTWTYVSHCHVQLAPSATPVRHCTEPRRAPDT